ncbi:MAG: nucleotidyltransferase family protein [Deltaproteobacteria bacterium]|nr:nucleotidyltransferase family protein [Deltaproteobacteria bacterium]
MDSSPSPPSGAILAAGSARRMRADKLLLDLAGTPIVRRIAEQALAAELGELLVIVRAENSAAVAAALRPLAVRIVANARAEQGMGTSIALAAASLRPQAEALLLLQGDQPLVGRDMLEALVARWRSGAGAFVASRFGDLVTTPVLFARELFAELRALDGDRGAKAVLERHRERGAVIDFPAWRGADVDTPEDYRRVRGLAGSAGEPRGS